MHVLARFAYFNQRVLLVEMDHVRSAGRRQVIATELALLRQNGANCGSAELGRLDNWLLRAN